MPLSDFAPPQTLRGKKCVVTAAAAGIGRATALRLTAAGAQVIAADIDGDGVARLADEAGASNAAGQLRAQTLDVTSGAQVQAFAESVGAVEVLFNCAGFVHAGTLLQCEERDWDFSFDLNVKSMYRMCRAFLPAMRAAGGGSIINMSSVASSIKGVPNRFVYTASKAAVIGLTKSVAVDFVGDGIRCNAICPGTVDSPSLRQRLQDTGDYDAAMRQFIARQPMGRIARADEIAALALYLASDDSAFVTGQAFVIDGGWTA